jgi:hypothetical protein
MPATTKVPLGPTTLNRKWYADVNTGTHAVPVWTGIFGITDFKPGLDPTSQDDSDYDSGGYKSDNVTALGWALELTLRRGVQDAAPTAYDVGQEVLRAASNLMGLGNKVELRWYEMPDSGPRTEAWQGYASVRWSENGGPMDANDMVACTLTGKGSRTAITHPDAAAVPQVFSVTPATGAAAGGELITIVGSGFTLATAVEIGSGHAASDYNIVDANHISAVVPAHAAGAHNVIVSNATGPSTDAVSFTYS